MLQSVRRALISVSDKSGVVELARALAARNIEILSTGGSARLLREAGIAVRDVADYTGFPEMMDGRVKTLHPKIHGGLLGRRGIDDAAMAEHQIAPIDLLVVNLYPFASVVATPQGLACLTITQAGATNCRTHSIAVSASAMLLNDSSLPCTVCAPAMPVGAPATGR